MPAVLMKSSASSWSIGSPGNRINFFDVAVLSFFDLSGSLRPLIGSIHRPGAKRKFNMLIYSYH